MKIVLCTGDSHTWGQGAQGLCGSFTPPVVSGDLRLAGFSYPSYVNRLRRLINLHTGSHAQEWSARACAERFGLVLQRNDALLQSAPIRLPACPGLLRLQFHLGDARAKATVEIDGEVAGIAELPGDESGHGYRLLSVFVPEECHVLQICAVEGTARLYRIESYSGRCGVVNSGIGSTSVGDYFSCYREDYVAALRPCLTVMEAHTINDWLAGDPPEVYYERLKEGIRILKGMGSDVLLLTVSPIAGLQTTQSNAVPYARYVEASRQAAADCRVPVCDANAVMSICVEGMNPDQANEFLFDDPWHVNDRGHALYAQLIYDAIVNSGNGQNFDPK